MKSLYPTFLISRFRFWGLIAFLLALNFTGAALATEPVYVNSSVLNYSIPGTPPPVIDASNFVNDNQFNVSYQQYGNNAQFYEPMNTVNYTNNSSGINTGIMSVGSPILTNTIGDITYLELYNSAGVGFQFDTQTTNVISHQEAGTFYNSGTIYCDSFLEGNNTLNLGDEGPTFIQGNVGQCLVWATNIICPGTIEAGQGGLVQLTGQNVDLSRSVLNIEQGLSSGISATNLGLSIGSEGEGFETNEWDPYDALTPTNAYASYPDNLTLTNSTPYFTEAQFGTNYIVRAVFLQNANTNTPASVYMQPSVFGNAGALIQWSGTYMDPVTGQTDTNYLYLFHYFIASTNLLQIVVPNALPFTFDNFVFYFYYNYLWGQNSPYSGLGPPTAAGFPYNTFNDSYETNAYEYFNGQLAGLTVNTNASPSNPSGALTNLPGRLQIIANHELNLALAQIGGQNYMSITATNQFDGSPGALIASPLSDINLGVTNGTLTVSNLLEANIPTWSGTLQEWSIRWLYTDPLGNNWDFRVMLVNSSLTPALAPQVQNLTLSATNLTISDELNVFGSMYANAQNLTLTTNTLGNGETSPEGELDMQEINPITWSWNSSFPNLLCLTNNGAIEMPNYADFYSDAQITNITPGVPSVQATNVLSESGGTNVALNATVTVGSAQYVFVNSLVNTTPYQVKIGTNFDGSMSNLVAAIDAGAGSGTLYSTNTYANSVASAGLLTSHAFTVTANSSIYAGPLGDGIPTTTTATNLTWGKGSALTGGVNGTPGTTNITTTSVPYGAIVNSGFLYDQGSTVWVTNFVNGGVISNNTGSFLLNSMTATLTNGSVTAGGDVSFTANTLEISNVMLQAGRSLALQVTNCLTDGGVTNGNVWTLGSASGTGGNGLVLPFLPTNTTPGANNLLGTSISMVTPPPNKLVSSTWAGLDYGYSTLGYNTNNVAIGQLTLNSLSPNASFYFSGPPGSTTSNAIYVDQLILENYASYANGAGTANIPTLFFNTNLVIYYADAVASETVNSTNLLDVSYLLNNSNTNHLRWVPQYTGHFSSTNIVYPGGTTYTINIGLALSPADSTGNGEPNYDNPYPLFEPSQLNLKFVPTNAAPVEGMLTWDSIPSATNLVLFTTNLASPNWSIIYSNVSSSRILTPSTWPITNVLFKTNLMSPPQGFYRVQVGPNSANEYP